MGSPGVTRAVSSLSARCIPRPLNPHCIELRRNTLQFLGENSRLGGIEAILEAETRDGGESEFKFTLLSFYALNIPRNHARGASQIGTVSSSHLLKFFELLDASLSMLLAIITLGSRTDLPGGRFVTRWCARRLPMLSVELDGGSGLSLERCLNKEIFRRGSVCISASAL